DLPLAEAREIAERFAAFESVVEVIPRSATLIAFDPRHPARTRQPLERMRITGPVLEIARGHIDSWPDADSTEQRRFEDPASLRAAADAQRHAWQDAGLELCADLLAFVNRTSPRNPELEQQFREADDPTQVGLVLADWLEAEGDPRGPLGALHHAGANEDAKSLLDRKSTQYRERV
ncbi:MAG: hypothetical protein KC457_37385, partial [Myxococcales bacterium]|nr:hypothetical protein [Myxococcales bacterium]